MSRYFAIRYPFENPRPILSTEIAYPTFMAVKNVVLNDPDGVVEPYTKLIIGTLERPIATLSRDEPGQKWKIVNQLWGWGHECTIMPIICDAEGNHLHVGGLVYYETAEILE